MKTALRQSLLKDSIGALRITFSFKAAPEKEKKNSKICWNFTQMLLHGRLLSAAQKGTAQIQDRRAEHMQIRDWMRLLLSPTALQSDWEDEGKSRKSAPFWKQSKISWGKKKEGRKKKASLSTAAITKTKTVINEKLQNLKSWLHKDIVVRPQILAMALLALSCILEAIIIVRPSFSNEYMQALPFMSPSPSAFEFTSGRAGCFCPQQKHICKPHVLIGKCSPRLSPVCCNGRHCRLHTLGACLPSTHPTLIKREKLVSHTSLSSVSREYYTSLPIPACTKDKIGDRFLPSSLLIP